MAEDLMQTQTGGPGETVQVAPEVQQTPQQFDVNIPSAPQPQPTEPVQPSGPPMAEAPIVANVPADIEQATEEVDSEQPEEEVGYMDWYTGDVSSAAEKILQDQTVPAVEEIQPPQETEPQVMQQAQEEIKVKSINGIPIEEQEDDDIVNSIPSDASDDDVEAPPVEVKSINGVPVSFEGVGKLPVLPLGVEADEFAELRNKYQGYKIESDIWGNVKATKEQPKETPKQQVKGTVTKEVKPKAPAVEEGKVLSYQYNQDFDYMMVDGQWKRKAKGTNNWSTLTNKGSIDALNKYFKTDIKPPKIYSYPGKKDYEYAVLDGTLNIRKKGTSSWNIITDPGRIKEFNRVNKTKVNPYAAQDYKANNQLAKSTEIQMQQGTLGGPAVSPIGKGNVFQQAPSRSILFSDKPTYTYRNPEFLKYDANQEINRLEKQRKLQLENAKTDAQRKIINQEHDKWISKINQNLKYDLDYQKKSQENIWKEIATPQKQPKLKPVTEDFNIYKELGISIDQRNIPIIEKMTKGYYDMPNISSNFINGIQSQAESFINKDLNSWRTSAGIDLTDAQFKEFQNAQKAMKDYLSGKESLTREQAFKLSRDIEQINNQVENAYKDNSDTNAAALSGQSLEGFELDYKKKLIKRLNSDEKLASTNEYFSRTKNMFNSSMAIQDFVEDYLKSGDIIKDKDGGYVVNPNIPELKKQYIGSKLAELNSTYEGYKRQEYNFFQEDIDKLRYEKKLLNNYIDDNKSSLKGMKPGSDEYKKTLQKINEATNKVYGLNNKINDLRNDTRGLLSTEPEKIVASLSGVIGYSDAKSIFSAIDKDLSPKVRFDRFYRRLREENDKLARQYNINTGQLDGIGQHFRSMLDWNAIGMDLSDEEKRWFANERILNSLMPVYFNNESGITKGSHSFNETILGNLKASFYGEDLAGAQGDLSPTVMLSDTVNELKRLGFTEKDLQNPIDLKALEKRKTADWTSGEGLAEIVAPSVAIILQMVLARGFGSVALKGLKGVSNLVKVADRSGNLVGYGDKLEKVYKAYEASVKSNRLGRIMWEAGEQGATFELTGEVFGISEDDMGLAQGFFGSLGGQAVGGLLNKLPVSKFVPIVNKIFGENTDKALKVMARAGNVMQTATGETAEEFFEELTSIYQSTLDSKGFFAELDNRFGTFDKVMKFAVTSYALGIGMDIGMPNKAKVDEIVEKMPEADREKVEEALTAIREVNETATEKMDVAAKEAAKEIQIEQAIGGKSGTEEQEKAEKEDAAIEFDTEGIIKNEKEGEQVTEEVTESSFTEPIDLSDDKENKPGISGEERKGEEPVKTEPVVETSKEEVSPSGVVQEEQEIDLSNKSIDELEKRQSELEGSKSFTKEREEFSKIEKELEKREWQSVLNAPLNEVNNIVDDLMIKDKEMPNGFGSYIDKSDAIQTKKVSEKYSKEVSKEESKKDFKDAFFGNPSSSYADALKLKESVRAYTEQGGSFKELLSSVQKEFESDGFTEQDAASVINRKLEEIQNKGLSESKQKSENSKKVVTEEKQTEPTKIESTKTTETTNQFDEVQSISKMPVRSPKRKQAVADFESKYGKGSYNRISKIDANFGDISKKLEESNIIKKEC